MVPRASAVIAFAFVAYCDLVVTCDDGLLWSVMMVYCDNGLLCLRHIIMPVMMVYCELWWSIVNWERSVIRDRLVKKGGFGRFAECNTRQRDALPSVEPKHSVKKPISIILGTFFAECFVFAECIQMDTRQSDHKICLLRACLPSVLGVTLGKVCKRWRVLWSWHSANFTTFTECFGLALDKL